MNKSVKITCLITSILFFSSCFCLAQSNSAMEIKALKENPKIHIPDRTLEGLTKDKLTLRVIVNLKDPLAEGPAPGQDPNDGDRNQSVSQPVRNGS